jgi:hypothetical protein
VGDTLARLRATSNPQKPGSCRFALAMEYVGTEEAAAYASAIADDLITDTAIAEDLGATHEFSISSMTVGKHRLERCNCYKERVRNGR